MLSTNSICNNCSNQKFCKYFDDINSNLFLTAEITKCDYNSKLNLQKVDDISTVLPKHSVPSEPNYTYYNNTRVSDFPDLNKVTTTNNVSVNTSSVIEANNGVCSICGKEAVVQNCIECGNPVCPSCAYTVVDINEKTPITTCDKCFGSSDKANEEEKIEWDISHFTETKENDKEIENGTNNKKTRNKRSNSKSENK